MRKFILEACVDSFESALAAKNGGADRVELCANLLIGGTTPTPWLFQEIKDKIGIPANILIRPRFGDFCYTDSEFIQICEAVKCFKNLGANGVVVGCLKPDGSLNYEQMQKLRELAGNMAMTLHRAFDMTADPFKACSTAIDIGVDTILTSGQQNSAILGADLLAELVKYTSAKIDILVGGGVSPDNIGKLYEITGATSYHMSGKIVVESLMTYRNKLVNMGMAGISEYEIWQTSAEKIKMAHDLLADLEGK